MTGRLESQFLIRPTSRKEAKCSSEPNLVLSLRELELITFMLSVELEADMVAFTVCSVGNVERNLVRSLSLIVSKTYISPPYQSMNIKLPVRGSRFSVFLLLKLLFLGRLWIELTKNLGTYDLRSS